MGSGYADDADVTLGSAAPAIFFHDTTGGAANAAIVVNNGVIAFRNGATGGDVDDLFERIQIANTGRMYFVTGGNEPSKTQTGLRLSGVDGENFWKSANSGTSAYDQLAFFNGTAADGGLVGKITTSGSGTAFTTSSDYRLKENVDYDWDATTRLKQLKPARFNFIVDADTTVDGFLAHEAQAVVPECVIGTKDATVAIGNITDKNGNSTETGVTKPKTLDEGHTWTETGVKPVMQSIDQAKLVPLLAKTILELEARITALEG